MLDTWTQHPVESRTGYKNISDLSALLCIHQNIDRKGIGKKKRVKRKLITTRRRSSSFYLCSNALMLQSSAFLMASIQSSRVFNQFVIQKEEEEDRPTITHISSAETSIHILLLPLYLYSSSMMYYMFTNSSSSFSSSSLRVFFSPLERSFWFSVERRTFRFWDHFLFHSSCI